MIDWFQGFISGATVAFLVATLMVEIKHRRIRKQKIQASIKHWQGSRTLTLDQAMAQGKSLGLTGDELGHYVQNKVHARYLGRYNK